MTFEEYWRNENMHKVLDSEGCWMHIDLKDLMEDCWNAARKDLIDYYSELENKRSWSDTGIDG